MGGTDITVSFSSLLGDQTMTDTAKRMARDLSDGYDDVVRGLSKMSAHLGSDAEDAVADAARDFVHAAANLSDKIKAQSEDLAKKAGDEVKEHPVAAAALAAAAVGLLGYAATRKARH
jgi:ElaB/YqjD/DUF883 family membrane-anchored ribosome-binding protein